MNIDFSLNPELSWYIVLLAISGVAMVVMGAGNFGALSNGWRIFNGVAGVGLLGYAYYLTFVFEGGTVVIFFKVFILPVMLIVNFVRSLSAKNAAGAAQQTAVPFQAQAPAPTDAQAQAQAQAPAQAPAQTPAE